MAVTAAAMGGVGAVCAVLPLVNSLNPAQDTMAVSTTEVDISKVEPGQEVKVMWQGKPVFIRHRTPDEVKSAAEANMSELKDPQADGERVQKGREQWLVTIGVCTHLGCIPIGNGSGDYKGWFCPCHGSHYDTSGRVRKGPAPENLKVPPYAFVSDTVIKIG